MPAVQFRRAQGNKGEQSEHGPLVHVPIVRPSMDRLADRRQQLAVSRQAEPGPQRRRTTLILLRARAARARPTRFSRETRGARLPLRNVQSGSTARAFGGATLRPGV